MCILKKEGVENMKKQTIISFLAAILLASCSSEDSADLTQLSAPVPLTFNVEVGGAVSTRADNATTEKGTNANIKNGEIIIYCYDTNWHNYTYTVDADGKVTSESPYYYDTTNEVTFYAKAEYNNTTDDLQNVKDGDYLYIEPTVGQVTVNGGAITLTFKHAASRLSFNVTNGDDVSADDLKNATFNFCGLCKKSNYSNSNGTFSGDDTSITISDYSKSHLVVPQTKDVYASITMNGVDYKTPTFSMTLDAGKSYTCNIKVSKTGINITSCDITDWTKVSSDPISETKTPIYTYGSIPYAGYSQVNQYALAFTDGSFENIDVDGTPSEDKIKALTSFQLKNVCGIVFSTENPTTYDKVLAADYPNCTHGLIVALTDAGDGIMKWQRSEYATVGTAGLSGDYVSVTVVKGKNDKSINTINQILGYNNTKIIRTYNSQCDAANQVLPVIAIDDMTTKAPSGTSGWYLPSVKEVFLLRWSSGTVSGTGEPSDASTDNVSENLMTILNCLKDYVTVNTTINPAGDSSSFWSSSEKGEEKAYYLDLKEKKLGIHESTKNEFEYYVRPVCAF
jgi:hypothetical protein